MDPFRTVLSAVRARLPDGVEAAELHAFLTQNGDVLRRQLSEALEQVQTEAAPIVPPGSNLWEHFHEQAAPRPGERGWRPEPETEDQAEAILEIALRYLDEPELFWMWQATRIAAGEAWAVWEDEEDGDPDELPELLGIPVRLERGHRWTLALGAVQLAMEAEGRALARGEDLQPDGRLPLWAAVGVLADRLNADAPMRLINVDRETAAAFIERHHSSLPCINLRGIMYALGVKHRGRLVAVATAGHPTGRWRRVNPRNVLELTRLASDGSTRNAASMLVARLLDLRERSRRGRPDEPALFITYQLSEAEGTVYRALQDKGLRPVARVPGRQPSGARKSGRLSPCQKRTGQTSSLGEVDKIRWEAA